MSSIFIGALVFSILYMILFFEKNLGLSVMLFIIPLVYYIIYILKKKDRVKNENARILIIPIALLSSTYFIFNNKFFYTLNIPVIILLIAIMIMVLLGERIKINTVIAKILNVNFKPLCYIGESISALKDKIKERLNIKIEPKKSKKIGKVIKGICISIPIVFVIILLLSSADKEFGELFYNIIKWIFEVLSKIKLSGIVKRLIFTGIIFVYALCFFYNITQKYNVEADERKLLNEIKDNTTVKILLGILNVVYLLFSIIQIKSLFIGDASINYAQYARKGFFQLMIVSFINIVTILYAKNTQKGGESKKYINSMCIIMCIFTFIILISSAVRMYFYESQYGYTLLRLLVYCTLLTETILLIPTIVYILDKKINLPKVYFIIVIIMYICMNFANFDNMIAKRNIDRYIETGKIDIMYLTRNTSTDVVKQIMRLVELDNEKDENSEYVKKQSRTYLKRVYDDLNDDKYIDFRELNLSELFARFRIKKGII